MLDISVSNGCQSCGQKFSGGWATCPACIEEIREAENRQMIIQPAQQAVLEQMLIDLGIKKSEAAEDAEMAMERINAGTPPLLALVQAVLSQAEQLRRNCDTRTGLNMQGERLAKQFYELLCWPTKEFDALAKTRA